jgi:NADH-quinone oxidoreductase subunit L
VLHYAFLLPLLPAISFVLILFFGKRLPRKGSEIGIVAVGLSWVLACVAGVQWLQHVNAAQHAAASEGEHAVRPILSQVTWFSTTIGGAHHDFTVGTFVDGLSVMMFFVVTTVSLLVHIYSTEYVDGDRRYTHYFAFLSLFTASMLMLIMSRNTIQFITSWELVGLCSFVLIGHWWEEKPNSDAALKAFLVNRVGDVGLLIGMIVLFFAAGGTFDIRAINNAANNGDISHLLLLTASLCLTAAVMSKSGQFILHVWLPDAMAGPTPVSALIHAATMVVAGIFMVARFYAVFFHGYSIGSGDLNLLAIIGGVTVIGGAALAFVQSDIKKVLAYSTVSQLGYMVMALGVGAWTAAVFHLFTHAFFKAGLFLGSGSVAHSVHSFDMKKDMGGMKRFMPRTFWTFVICSMALAGIPPLAGFWSKDEILAAGHEFGRHNSFEAFLVVGLVGAFMTAAYMTRCIYLTFFGDPRGAAADPHHHPHESGPRILVPIYILTGMSVIAGLANWPFGPRVAKLRFEHYVQPVSEYFPHLQAGTFVWPLAIGSALVALAGVGIGYAYWWRGALHGATERSRVARGGYVLLENKYYFDVVYEQGIAAGISGPIARAAYWFNQNVIDGIINGTAIGVRHVAQFTYKYIDQGVVDGAINGSGLGAEESGQVLRRIQTGRVQQYGALLFGGAVVLAAIFIVAI